MFLDPCVIHRYLITSCLNGLPCLTDREKKLVLLMLANHLALDDKRHFLCTARAGDDKMPNY